LMTLSSLNITYFLCSIRARQYEKMHTYFLYQADSSAVLNLFEK